MDESVAVQKMDESSAVQEKMDESSAVQEKMDESLAVEEEQAPSNEDEALTQGAFFQSPFLEMNPQTTPTKVKDVPSTPTFTFRQGLT